MKITDVTSGPEPLKPTFRGWLGHHMKEKGWSLRQLGQAAGIDHSTISKILAEKHEPKLETARRIARALEVRLPE